MNASIDSERLIDRIYEAGLVPSLWPALLGELGAAVGGNGGFLFGVRDGYTSAVNSVEYDQLMPVFLKEGWSERDPNLPRAIALNHAGFVTDYDLLSEEEIATNEVYCNFYRKHGIGYRAGTLIPIPSGDSIAIVMPRHQDRGPVPREVVACWMDCGRIWPGPPLQQTALASSAHLPRLMHCRRWVCRARCCAGPAGCSRRTACSMR